MRAFRIVCSSPAPHGLEKYFLEQKDETFRRTVVTVDSAKPCELIRTVRENFRAESASGICPVDFDVSAFFFDMDSTVIAQESIVELARVCGKEREVGRITEKTMAGEIDFREALKGRVSWLKGVPASVVERVSETVTLNRGMRAFAAFCKSKKIPLFLISSGFVPVAMRVSNALGFTAYHANRLEISNGALTGRTEGRIVDAEQKKAWLLAVCKNEGIDPLDVCVVGDGANDLPMMKVAGLAVGFRAKRILHPHIHALNGVGDHRFLIPLIFGDSV